MWDDSPGEGCNCCHGHGAPELAEELPVDALEFGNLTAEDEDVETSDDDDDEEDDPFMTMDPWGLRVDQTQSRIARPREQDRSRVKTAAREATGAPLTIEQFAARYGKRFQC